MTRTEIPTCDHRVPYPAGWNRALDSERRAQWPDYCTPCPKCNPMPKPRPETGTMKFGDDWMGVFIRGDDAFGYANALAEVLSAEESLAAHELKNLLDLLRSTNEHEHNASQVLLPFPECHKPGPVEVPKDVQALIAWRDKAALDWWGEDLVFHIIAALKNEPPEGVPEEHRVALRTFQALSEDEQYEVTKSALIACKSY